MGIFNKDNIEKIDKQMDESLKQMMDKKGGLSDYLKMQAQFPERSPENIVLLQKQNKDATMVKDANEWKEFGRTPTKGTEIKLLESSKDENQKGYNTVEVYDINDTKGKELATEKDVIKDHLKDDFNKMSLQYDMEEQIQQDYGYKTEYLREPDSPAINTSLDNKKDSYVEMEDRTIYYSINDSEKNNEKELSSLINGSSEMFVKEGANGKETPDKLEAKKQALSYVVAEKYELDTKNHPIDKAESQAKSGNLNKQDLKEIQQMSSHMIKDMDRTLDDKASIKDKVNNLNKGKENQKEKHQNKETEKKRSNPNSLEL